MQCHVSHDVLESVRCPAVCANQQVLQSVPQAAAHRLLSSFTNRMLAALL